MTPKEQKIVDNLPQSVKYEIAEKVMRDKIEWHFEQASNKRLKKRIRLEHFNEAFKYESAIMQLKVDVARQLIESIGNSQRCFKMVPIDKS